jgi:hypothetical protein
MNGRGVTLIVVMWTIVAISSTALIGMSAVKDLHLTAAFRGSWIRGRWAAQGCLEYGRARLEDRIDHGGLEALRQIVTDGIRLQLGEESSCDLTVAIEQRELEVRLHAVAHGRLGGRIGASVEEKWIVSNSRIAVLERVLK